MTTSLITRRGLLASGTALAATGAMGLDPAGVCKAALRRHVQCAAGPTTTARALPIVERIGGGGFWMSGTVRRAGDGVPLAGQRIQIWAHTTEGHERDPHSHGATLTDENGNFRLEMPQIVPAFGQPHGHLAYDSGEFETVFLRPIMPSSKDKSLSAHFVLQPV